MAWAPDYCTSPELKAFLRVNDAVDDAQIAVAVSAASRAIDKYTGRQFGKVAALENREYGTAYDRHQGVYTVAVDDLQDVTGLVVTAGSTVLTAATPTAPGYKLYPVNALPKGRPYEWIAVPNPDLLTITALWGWTAVPASVKQATLLQASRFMARRESPYGVAGSPTDGSEMRLLARVDPDVAVSLDPFRRDWWAA